MNPHELLSLFGLTRIEAAIYTELLTGEDFTGYELSKLTGVSRSNTYTALASLCEKGGAYIIEGTPAKYTAVGIEEFCKNRIRTMEEAKKELCRILPKENNAGEGYITVTGSKNIENKIYNLLENTEKRVYFAAEAKYAERFESLLSALASEGRKVVIITDSDIVIENVQVFKTSDRGGQIRLIVDSVKVLTGDESSCLYSEKENLVNVIKDSLKYELRLIKYGLDALEE